MIRAVVSDFGGVLTTPITTPFAAVAARAGLAVDELRAALAVCFADEGAHPFFELECGRMTEAQFLASLEQALRRELGREISCADFSEAMWAGLAPNERMIELMAALRGEGYRMALVTNNVREWEPRWRAMAPIDDIFELVIDSAYVGVRKPDPQIYELTVQRLGVPAPECLFVDDLESNCAAARAAGMQAIVYRDAEQAEIDIRGALDGSGGA
ncbi:MAG TPA: HAD family phosphatase [Solirubrobacteraceae bacterium]